MAMNFNFLTLAETDIDFLAEISTTPFLLQQPILLVQSMSSQKVVRLSKKLAKSGQPSLAKFSAIPDLLSAGKLDGSQSILADIGNNSQYLSGLIDVIVSENLATNAKMIVVADDFNSHSSVSRRLFELRINQQVYFLSKKTLDLTEFYSINGVPVQNILGKYSKTPSKTMKFVSNPMVSKDFIQRRSNFQGQHLNAMTESFPMLVHLKSNFDKEARFFEANQTYDVTDYASGLYINFFKLLAKNLNFTYSLFKRLDGGWGSVVGNKSTGMFGNVARGSADIVVQAFSLTIKRLPAVDYLPVISADFPGIFIQREQRETISWMTYLRAFHRDLWAMIAFIAIVMALFLYCGNMSMDLVSMSILSVTVVSS